MADEHTSVDVELAACFLGVPYSKSLAVLNRLEKRGLLAAQGQSAFSLRRAAYEGMRPPDKATTGRRRYK